MKIGIIGAGSLGTGLAKRLLAKDHGVVLSYSRDVSKLETTAHGLGARAGTVADAVSFGEVILLATPYTAFANALKQAGDSLAGKIIWDCTNPLKPDFSGLLIGTTTSAGALAPTAQVVKAIPPFAEVLHSNSMDCRRRPARSVRVWRRRTFLSDRSQPSQRHRRGTDRCWKACPLTVRRAGKHAPGRNGLHNWLWTAYRPLLEAVVRET